MISDDAECDVDFFLGSATVPVVRLRVSRSYRLRQDAGVNSRDGRATRQRAAVVFAAELL